MIAIDITPLFFPDGKFNLLTPSRLITLLDLSPENDSVFGHYLSYMRYYNSSASTWDINMLAGSFICQVDCFLLYQQLALAITVQYAMGSGISTLSWCIGAVSLPSLNG
jgi:hypothetical protein